jgi:hypothetical protein
MRQDNDIVKTFQPVIAIFDPLRIPFYVGGSIASSFHGAIWQATSRRSCFSLINFGTSLKVDIVISRERPFDRECMLRAEKAHIGDENGTIEVTIATVEDTIISKLEWYWLNDETSERQWDNVSRLILLVGSVLDTGYRRNYSTIVAVSDLLDRQLDS